MLSDDAVEDGACLARNVLFGLEDIQIKLIGKYARRQGVICLEFPLLEIINMIKIKF